MDKTNVFDGHHPPSEQEDTTYEGVRELTSVMRAMIAMRTHESDENAQE